MRTLKALATAMAVVLFVNVLGAIGNAVPRHHLWRGAKANGGNVFRHSDRWRPAEDIRSSGARPWTT